MTTEKELNLIVLMNALEFYFKSIRETLDKHKVLKDEVNENHNYSKCYNEWLTKQYDLISGWVKKPEDKKIE